MHLKLLNELKKLGITYKLGHPQHEVIYDIYNYFKVHNSRNHLRDYPNFCDGVKDRVLIGQTVYFTTKGLFKLAFSSFKKYEDNRKIYKTCCLQFMSTK